MQASLTLRGGVLWLCRSIRTARVAAFDLDGRPLGRGFSFGGLDGGRTEIRGIAADGDRRLWVADAAASAVRSFSAFGLEGSALESRGDPHSDKPTALGEAAGIAAQGVESELRLLLSRRGVRRHALTLLDPTQGTQVSLRPRGDPDGTFANLAGVALAGRLACACETGSGGIQIFRDGEFHFLLKPPAASPGGRTLEPRAVAALEDGRTVVAFGGSGPSAVMLFDAGGRLVRILATADAADGDAEVSDPRGVAVEAGESERTSRVAVLDRAGDRVQVFSLEGQCYGSFIELDPTPPEGLPAVEIPGSTPWGREQEGSESR